LPKRLLGLNLVGVWGRGAPRNFGTLFISVTVESYDLGFESSLHKQTFTWGVPNFWGAVLAQTHASFGPESCFLVSYTPNPNCLPNLKC